MAQLSLNNGEKTKNGLKMVFEWGKNRLGDDLNTLKRRERASK